ncbi:MAG: hypothetical protein M0P30_13655 [Syntrophorhabdaceae bacterium]|nr:hypothetical protein [Syntrophorhabdaceae bacterium]
MQRKSASKDRGRKKVASMRVDTTLSTRRQPVDSGEKEYCLRGSKYCQSLIRKDGYNSSLTMVCSDNDDKFRGIIKSWEPEHEKLQRYDIDGKVSIFLATQWTPPFTELEELSAEHPEITFTASYCCQCDCFFQEYITDFQAGAGRLICIKAAYYWPVIEGINDKSGSESYLVELPDRETFNRLTEQIEKVFQRIDRTATADEENGEEFYDGQVSVDAASGDWLMRATKMGPIVHDLSLFKKVEGDAWEEVEIKRCPSFCFSKQKYGHETFSLFSWGKEQLSRNE